MKKIKNINIQKNIIDSPMPFHERLAVVAKSIKFTPGKHLTLEKDLKTNVWWLCVAIEGDQPFSITKQCTTMHEALDHIEKWISTQLENKPMS